MPRLIDASGRYTIDGASTPTESRLLGMGATSILHYRATGALAGVYVDNETPERDAVAKGLATIIDQFCSQGQVVVGLYPSEPGHRIEGCLCAYEWYPFHKHWGWVPRGPEAYILQWHFAWPGDTPPTVLQRNLLLARTRLYRPKMILLY